jgi:hypothetical protein
MHAEDAEALAEVRLGKCSGEQHAALWRSTALRSIRSTLQSILEGQIEDGKVIHAGPPSRKAWSKLSRGLYRLMQSISSTRQWLHDEVSGHSSTHLQETVIGYD